MLENILVVNGSLSAIQMTKIEFCNQICRYAPYQ